MRILFLNPCAQLGGAERCLLDVLTSLRQTQPSWRLDLLTGEDGPVLDEAKSLGIEASCLPFPRAIGHLGAFGNPPLHLMFELLKAIPAGVAYLRSLRCAIRRINPDLIHTNGFKMHVLGAWGGSVPVIWHLHDYLSQRPWMARVLRLSARRCSGIVAISRSVAQDAREYIEDRVAVETILNGVDLTRFAEKAEAIKTGVPLRVGLIATFARWKGHEVFLRALARPELRNLPIQAYIIGGPIYQTSESQHSHEHLECLARELGIEKRVVFTGFLPDCAAAMRTLDVVVHASTQAEPFGLVIAEAMACGCTVIASQAGGATEIFTHGRDAWGTPPGDERALAGAILRLANDPAERSRLGKAARETAQARFNRDRLGPALSSFYIRILRGLGDQCEYSTSTAEISTAA